MALLEAVAFRPDQPRVPCCVLRSHGGVASAGEFEETIKRGVVVHEGEGIVAAPPPPNGSACCAWAGVAATSWVGPVPSTLATSSSTRRPLHHQPTVRRRLPRRRRGPTIATAARTSVVEAAESQRQNHITVERNRRRQMNEYLSTLRSLMPPSYARRGDQASIVGGAITFVKELEHRLQSLQAQRRLAAGAGHGSESFPGFFRFPQYSTAVVANVVDDASSSGGGERRPAIWPEAVADVEAAVSEGHATVRLLAPRRRRQMLLRLLLGMQRRGLAALHVNATTTADQMVLYTFSLKMGDEWQLSSSAGDVAATVHGIVAGMDAEEGRAIYPAN